MKKSRKLVLNRETLHGLELRGVAGAVTLGIRCQTDTTNETYGWCGGNTMENCSAINYCATGGACSTSGSCQV